MKQFCENQVQTVTTTQAHSQHTHWHVPRCMRVLSGRDRAFLRTGADLSISSFSINFPRLDWICEEREWEVRWGVRWTLKHYTQAERLNWSAWLRFDRKCKNPYRFVLHLKPNVAFTWRSSETKDLTNKSQPNKPLASVSLKIRFKKNRTGEK